jgi:hypothetical protein
MTHCEPNPTADHPDDIALRPDDACCRLGDIEEMRWTSDDDEIVWLEDMTRVREFGILDDLT